MPRADAHLKWQLVAIDARFNTFFASRGADPVSLCLMRNHLSIFRLSAVLFAASTLVFGTGFAGALYAQVKQAPEPHTAAAVIADDEGWSKAETSGDATYVDALLLPNYRSISSDGSTHDKAAILAHTAKSKGTKEDANKVDKWKADHPYVTSVDINGDLAILTFALNKGGDPKPVLSCDIFVYRDGRWRALYSQHTEAGK